MILRTIQGMTTILAAAIGRGLTAIALFVAILLVTAGARAQLGLDQGEPPPSSKAPVNPKEPVTHAASGASDDTMRLGGTEPSLPSNPLLIPDKIKKQIGSDSASEEHVPVPGDRLTRLVIPPYYSERSGSYSFKTLFPVWVERKETNDRASLFGLVYYNRRSTRQDADVLFPIFWNVRDDDTHLTVVGPFMHQEKPGAHDNWLAPLFFTGSRQGGGYFHIPPLLTFTHYNEKGGFNWIGLYYCSWSGGSECSPSNAEDIDYGVPPFFFAGKGERSRYEFVLPLLHYFHYSEVDDSSLNVWGPLFWKHKRDADSFNVFPLFWHTWGTNEDHVTVFPFIHYGYEGTKSLLVTPLFLTARGEHGESTFASWLYARYRGRTTLDMITPLYWQYEDPDIGLNKKLFFPFYWSQTSPRGDDTLFFPFYLHQKRAALSESLWVTPLFRYGHDLSGWSVNVFPFFYLGRSDDTTHAVLAPVFWDFANSKSRTTVGFPIYWRFANETSVSQVLGNTYYHERKVGSGLDWEVHIFPAFSYGETPDGHWWNVLYGLAGYTRRGSYTNMRAMWVPITLSE
jgi:hypothetical protein